MGPVVQVVQVGRGCQLSQEVPQSQSLVGPRYPFLPSAQYFPGNPENRDLEASQSELESYRVKTKNIFSYLTSDFTGEQHYLYQNLQSLAGRAVQGILGFPGHREAPGVHRHLGHLVVLGEQKVVTHIRFAIKKSEIE